MPHAPPRTTVEVSGLPLGVDAEVDITVNRNREVCLKFKLGVRLRFLFGSS